MIFDTWVATLAASDIRYPHRKFGVNRPRQTHVIERKPKVDVRSPALQHYNNQVFKEKKQQTNTQTNKHKIKYIRLDTLSFASFKCKDSALSVRQVLVSIYDVILYLGP
jgi:hypothetical protein